MAFGRDLIRSDSSRTGPVFWRGLCLGWHRLSSPCPYCSQIHRQAGFVLGHGVFFGNAMASHSCNMLPAAWWQPVWLRALPVISLA